MKMHGAEPVTHWDGKIYCRETDAALTFRANETHGYMAAYTFTLVVEGWLTILYNDKELTLLPDDIYIYSPGMPVSIIAASDDYHAICLLADEHSTFESPTVHDLVQIAYAPIVQLHEPKMTLKHEDAQQLQAKMNDITKYLHSNHVYKAEILKMLYAIFLLDLQNAQENAIPHHIVAQRVEEHFLNFIRMLPKHFREHRDIDFYASKLNITTTYLSRIVRQTTGHTVTDYINQMLLMEASFLLRNSQLSIAQIASQLHFSEPATFTRFFLRMRGMTPKKYRTSSEL